MRTTIVKIWRAKDHFANLEIVFNVLRNDNMKVDPIKWAFGVSLGNFLSHIVGQRGIKANSAQFKALLGTMEPKNRKGSSGVD